VRDFIHVSDIAEIHSLVLKKIDKTKKKDGKIFEALIDPVVKIAL